MTSTLGFGTSDELPISLRIPGYRLRRHVGTDAIGLWFDCVQESLGRKLTLKTLKPELEEHAGAHREFLAEMDRLSGLEHRNVLRVIDTKREPPMALITERIGAKTVKTLLDQDRTVKHEPALRYLTDAARGLAYLHGEGFTHKNLNPAMLAINDSDVCRVVTFRNIVTMDELAALRGKLMQDARYVAPEQLGGDAPIGPTTTTYQLAAILFHMLAGRPPHDLGNAKETALAHFREPFPALRGKAPFLPAGIYALVEECTARDPDARPEVSAMADRMEAILAGKDTSGKGAAPRPRRRRRRRR
ncbi:MAG: serine/threonine protein kinase [Planctomycetota bacterium]